MEARNTWKLLFAVTGATLIGACAHKPPPQVAAPSRPPEPSARSSVSPPAAPVADRARSGELDLVALLRESVIHFDFDAADLTHESQLRLQKIADALSTHRHVEIKVAGHCDDRGTEEYNLALGNKRAEVAKKYLVRLGVEPNRIQTISYGEERPVDTRGTDEAWAANRRDEFSPIGGP
jgi:peptidoglycan-associated lipoprotein